jgi:hypothetical protein
MKSFKQFLLSEDLGIGPEGTSKNPSIKNYVDSLKRETDNLRVEMNRNKNNPGEMQRIRDSLDQKRQELQNTRLLINTSNVSRANTPSDSSLQTSNIPLAPALPGQPQQDNSMSKQSAFDKLMSGTNTNNVSLPTTPNLGSQTNTLPVGYESSGPIPSSSLRSPNLNTELLGKTAKSYRL